MPRIEANRIKGLVPALDNKKITQPVVLDGENFLVEVDGLRSGFGRTEISHELLVDITNVQIFTTDTATSWICTTGCILQYDVLTNTVVPVYVFTEPVDKFPWSMALVGGKYYFARRGVGLIEYIPTTASWHIVNGSSYGVDIPSSIIGCCESGGRLVVLAHGLVAWSVIDDGTTFTPSTVTGAGFQSLAIIGSFSLDSPLGVFRVNDGFLTFTRNGVMKSVFTNTIVVFRHRRLSAVSVPLNHDCIVQTKDDNVIYLAVDGFYRTTGDVPEIWQPLMSEYFRVNLLELRQLTANGQLKLTSIPSKSWLFVSLAELEQPYIYTKAFVWCGKVDEWGSFDRTHSCIADFTTSLDNGVFYFDSFGSLYQFVSSAGDSLTPTLTYSQTAFVPVVQMPARTEDGITKMPSVFGMSTFDESAFINAGFYDKWAVAENVVSFDTTTSLEMASEYVAGGVSLFRSQVAFGDGLSKLVLALVPFTTAPLDSFVEVGPFRLIVNEAAAEYSTVTDVMLGSINYTATISSSEDWLTMQSSSEDWMSWSPTTYENWGGTTSSSSGYTANISASVDGYLEIETQTQILEAVQTSGRSSIFACYSTGLFHQLRVEAMVGTEYYYLKIAELTGIVSGRAF